VDPATGTFVDPAGNGGVYAGLAKPSSAENWVDLMMDPRTT
jgi:phospholipid/cholesterol/gamma-HCH transport system substrate-binding protein